MPRTIPPIIYYHAEDDILEPLLDPYACVQRNPGENWFIISKMNTFLCS